MADGPAAPPKVNLGLISDDIKYLFVAGSSYDNFRAFLADPSLSRRRFGRRLDDLLAIQQFAGDTMLNLNLMAYFFNMAQREALCLMRPDVTAADLAIYFPEPPTLVESAQVILQRMDSALMLRAMSRVGGAHSFHPSGRGRQRRRGRSRPRSPAVPPSRATSRGAQSRAGSSRRGPA